MSDLKKLAATARQQGLRPILHENHKKPVSRRELIGQGFLAGTGLVFGPSLLSMFGGAGVARAAEGCVGDASSTVVPVNGLRMMLFEAAGGMNIAGSNFMVYGKGGVGDHLSAKALGVLGLPGSMAGADQVSTEFGIPMHAQSPLLEGLRFATSPETRDGCNGFVTCVTSMDDSTANQFSPVYYMYKAGALGALSHVIGSETSAHGARSLAPAESIISSLSSTRVNRYDDARNLVSAASLEELLPGQVANVLKAATKMSEARLKAFAESQMPEQIRELVRCGYAKSAEAAQGNLVDAVDASKDTALIAALAGVVGTNTRNFQVTRDANNDENQATLSQAYLLLKGYAACATRVMGGRDYHNNPRAETNQKDFEVGYQMGLALESARVMGKSIVLVLYTDGGVGCSDPETPDDNSTQANGQAMFTGDRGEGSCMVTIAYHPSGRPGIANPRQQVNAFNENGGVDQNFAEGKIVANSVTNAVQCIVLNILALHGQLADADKVLGSNHPFKDVMDQYVMFQPFPA